MRNFIPEILAVLSIIAAVALLVYQQTVTECPIFFHVEDAKSHETAALMVVTAGIFLVIGKYLWKMIDRY